MTKEEGDEKGGLQIQAHFLMPRGLIELFWAYPEASPNALSPPAFLPFSISSYLPIMRGIEIFFSFFHTSAQVQTCS